MLSSRLIRPTSSSTHLLRRLLTTSTLPSPSTAASQPAPPLTVSKPPRPSKLRPRKAAMTLTPSALSQLRSLLSQPEPKLIRVGVKNRGCSGLAYNLEYVEKPGSFDETVEQEGVKVLIDSKALFSIIGSEMDFVEDKLNRRFVFRNPNISMSRLSCGGCCACMHACSGWWVYVLTGFTEEQCGCGESFMV